MRESGRVSIIVKHTHFKPYPRATSTLLGMQPYYPLPLSAHPSTHHPFIFKKANDISK